MRSAPIVIVRLLANPIFFLTLNRSSGLCAHAIGVPSAVTSLLLDLDRKRMGAGQKEGRKEEGEKLASALTQSELDPQ